MVDENTLLGEALTGTETAQGAATPGPAQAEQTQPEATDPSAQTPDSSLQALEPGEQAKPEQPETQAELDFKGLREQKTTLETELSGLRTKLDAFGGESHLELMQPVISRAMEIPRTSEEASRWGAEMFQDLGQVLMPPQMHALKSQAAWAYINHPESAGVITQSLYGEGVTPTLLESLVAAHRADPTILDVLKPYGETEEQQRAREAGEERERQRDAEIKQLKESEDRRAAEVQAFYTQQTMTAVFQTGLAPRAEVKKQYGLEFQKSDKDTPEISAFKERSDRRYDVMTNFLLGGDAELKRLTSQAEYLAGQPNEQVRQRAATQFAPAIEKRTRIICSQVAKELAQDLTLFSPELSDRAKAEALKDLPPQVLGGSPQGNGQGLNLAGMPDAATDLIGFQKWLAKNFPAAPQGPAILTAG